ncbi:prolyl oligopeptidase family serine peptidase [Streptomyces hirsutus]
MPDWEKRFRAPRVSLPDWAEDAPDRSLFVSNATGTYELYAWDRSTGEQRQVTARPNGTTDGVLSPDGEWIWWFDDKDGDEFGVWRRQPFAGGPDELAAPGLDASYPAGLALGRGREDGRRGPLHGRGRYDDPPGASRPTSRRGRGARETGGAGGDLPAP